MFEHIYTTVVDDVSNFYLKVFFHELIINVPYDI